ncbi:MAG: sarcosine oxidase subunit delta [Dongiaceae bacterium]
MHLFHCPFCGARDETEFRYSAEAGKQRPRPSREASPESWARYLYFQRSPKGAIREIWVHQACGEFFIMQRDNVTHEVLGTEALRSEESA